MINLQTEKKTHLNYLPQFRSEIQGDRYGTTHSPIPLLINPAASDICVINVLHFWLQRRACSKGAPWQIKKLGLNRAAVDVAHRTARTGFFPVVCRRVEGNISAGCAATRPVPTEL